MPRGMDDLDGWMRKTGISGQGLKQRDGWMNSFGIGTIKGMGEFPDGNG